MEIHERIKRDGEIVFKDLTAQGISFEVTPKNKLKIKTQTTVKQFNLIRLWKAQIIDEISPKCSNCKIAMQLIKDGKLWFCPLGCISYEVEKG
jgi:hypothetical protein